jgi:hypothetical protein
LRAGDAEITLQKMRMNIGGAGDPPECDDDLLLNRERTVHFYLGVKTNEMKKCRRSN